MSVNVTLLFSREHYLAAAEAYLRGIERRIAAGLDPQVGSVASVFISRWDVALMNKIPAALGNRLGIAIAGGIYKAYLELLSTPRWLRAYNAGARPQRLLWASTGTKDPKASDTLYVKALAAPFTVNTIPEETLKAFADHGEIGPIMPADGGDCEKVLAQFAQAGVNVEEPGCPPSGRGREIVCEILERTTGGDCHQERHAQESPPTRRLNQRKNHE